MNKQKTSQEQYKQLIQEMLNELKNVLGEKTVIRLGKEVEGLTLSSSGKVIQFSDDPQETVQKLIDKFVGLSNEIIITGLKPLLKQCPWIKIPNVYANTD